MQTQLSAKTAAMPVMRAHVVRPAVTTTSSQQLPGLARRLPALQQVAARKSVVVSASEAAYDEGLAGKNDYAPLISVVGFVAVWFNKLQIDRVKLLHGLAILTLFNIAVNLLTEKGVGDGISNVVAPATLAVAVLNLRRVSYLDAATAFFGYYLSRSLESLTGLPFYVYLATLAAALYTGYGTLWYVGAFGVAAAGKLYKSTSNKDPLPVIVIPGVVAAAFAIYKEAHFPLALCLYLGQVVWSGLKSVDALTKKVEKESN